MKCYNMHRCKPDISHVVGVLSRYIPTPKNEHWIVVNRVFKYLCGTIYFAICYQGKPETEVHGFVDLDYTGDPGHRWSTIGHVFKLFSGEVSWMSRI